MLDNNEQQPTETRIQLDKIEQRLSHIANLLERQTELHRKPIRRRWRTSLRLILVLMAILAAVSAWVGVEIRRGKLQQQAMETLSAGGALVNSTPSDRVLVALMPGSPADPPAALKRQLGPGFFTDIRDIVFLNTQVPANRLSRPQAVFNMRAARARGANPTQFVNATMAGPIPVDDLRHALAGAPYTENLSIKGVTLRTDQLAEVFQMSRLESLDISRTVLDQNPIPDIANTSLKWLDASHTWLGDQAAHDLAECTNLVHLNMDRTTLTDAGLEYLKRLKRLRSLSVQRAHVTPKGIRDFADAMPNCYIVYQELKFDASGRQDPNASAASTQVFGMLRQDTSLMSPYNFNFSR